MKDIFLNEEMEMPVPCLKCEEWFDLNDGIGSKKWFPNKVICSECGNWEEKEIERDEEIEDLKNEILDAESTIKYSQKRLKELGVELEKVLADTPDLTGMEENKIWEDIWKDIVDVIYSGEGEPFRAKKLLALFQEKYLITKNNSNG